jgi:hypothetical protein
MSRRTRVLAGVAISISALLAAALAGCGASSESVTTVEGQVSYEDSPIAKGAVIFFPKRGRPTTAATDETGHYATELAPGQYKVTINLGVDLPPGWKEGDPVPPQTLQIPPQYTTRVRTPLLTTVTPSGAEPTNFDLP